MKTKENLIELLVQAEDKFRYDSDYKDIEQTCQLVLEEIKVALSAKPPDAIDYLSLHARTLNISTAVLQAWGMTNEAILCAEETLEIAKQAQNRTEEAKALGLIGQSYSHLSEFPRALEYCRKALEIGREIGAQNIVASNLGNIGSIYDYLGDFPKALEYMEQSLDVYQELGRKDGVSINLIHIGGVYLSLSDNFRALEYCKKALLIAEEIGSQDLIANALGLIGGAYRSINRPLAVEYLHKSLAILEEIGNKSNIATTTTNIGLVYVGMREYSLGLEYYLKALAMNSTLGDKSSIAITLGNIGVVYAKIDFEGYDAEKAEEYMLQSIILSEEVGAQEWLIMNYDQLAALYEKEKRWEESQLYFKKFHNLDKKVRGEEAVKAANLMEQRRQASEHEKALEVERAEATATKKLLHNTLPPEIASRILSGEKIADFHQHVSVLFADIVGFTQLSSQLPPRELIDILDIVFTRFDTICKKHGLEKIKTIGDAYMAVCGAPVAAFDHAERTALAALEMLEDFTMEQKFSVPIDLDFRIGLHSGSVVAGIIGENKYSYDLWGDAVNTASRMESHGEPGKIHVSEEFVRELSQSSPTSPMSLHFQERGEMAIKGKGIMKTYFWEKL